MEERTRNRLEERLKEMMVLLEERSNRKKRKPRSGKGRVIRRRKGEKEKRVG